MTISPLMQVVIPLIVTLLGGSALGAWFTHRRELPKARAEARNMDWVRFQGEIARLDKKIEALQVQNGAQEAELSLMKREVEDCHQRKDEMIGIVEAQNVRIAAQDVKIQNLKAELAKYRGGEK